MEHPVKQILQIPITLQWRPDLLRRKFQVAFHYFLALSQPKINHQRKHGANPYQQFRQIPRAVIHPSTLLDFLSVVA